MAFPRAFGRLHRRYVNPVMLRLAGHATFADLEHVGRRTGTVRHTPVRAFRSPPGRRDTGAGERVVIAVNFGRRSDWLRNVLAAGRCRLRLGSDLLELGEPRLIPVAEGVRAMPWPVGLVIRYVIRTRDCVELRVLGHAPAARDPAAVPDPP